MGQALVTNRRSRTLSRSTKIVYMTILRNGGPLAHNYLSQLLLGPDIRTTKRAVERFEYPLKIGFADAFFRNIKDMLCRYGLKGCPLLVSEDGTALQIRVDIDYDAGAQQIFVFGLCGGSYMVTSVQQFKDLVRKRGLATIIYVYTIVPLVGGAPHIPLCAFLHDDSNHSFTTDTVLTCWRYIWQVSLPYTDRASWVGHLHNCQYHAISRPGANSLLSLHTLILCPVFTPCSGV